MKYYATVDGRTYEISVDGTGSITVDGVPLTADMQRIGRLDLFSLLIDNVSHEVAVEGDSDQRNTYNVLVEGTRYDVKVLDERTRRLSLADRSLKPPPGELSIRAPIPGLVVKVTVTPGQTIGEGETVVILEAMKMENELRAPRAGVVHEVRVEAGAQVSLGQVLVSIRAHQ
jgi:biotin carboxyl carrier protein